jgi:hypothetical protein
MDFEIQFTDLTLLQANGSYKKVCRIMNVHTYSTGASSKRNEWMVSSRVTIRSPFGFAMLECHFYWNGKVYIADYRPSSKDIHNTDIRCLTCWCNESGWKTPEPLPSIADSWLPFWRKEWDTYIVDSEYLEKKYGARKDLQFDDDPTTDEDEDERIELI